MLSIPLSFLPVLAPAVCAPAALAVQEATVASEPRKVAIVVYPRVELLDFAGPAEVFATTRAHDTHAFEVYLVAESLEPVSSLGCVTVTPQYTLDTCPKPDIVVVPGGAVPLASEKLRSWVSARSRDTELVMSVCNGALVLGRAGLLDGLEATSHKSALADLALIAPDTQVLTNRRFVDSGRVMTSAGISAGIDGALRVVERMCGEEVAWQTASYMEYDWRPDELAQLHEQPGRPVEGADALHWVDAVRKKGLEGALADYEQAEKPPSESELNRWGYTLIRSQKPAEGLDVLRLANAAFPLSANAADSLSEALEASDRAGSKKLAQECLARLEQDPALDAERKQMLHNASASRIARLSGATASVLRFGCPPCSSACDQVGYVEGGRCPGCPMQLALRGE